MKWLFLTIAMFLFQASLFAQANNKQERVADIFFQNKDYSRALEVYLQANEQQPGIALTLARIGVCYYETNDLDKAKEYLLRSFNSKSKVPVPTYLYLGKTFHAELDFEKAIEFYKNYLKKTDTNDPLREAVKGKILQCATGMKVRRMPAVAAVVNIGDEVNSAADDFKPLPSPNFSDILYFSSDRQREGSAFASSFDIYFSTKNKEKWETPEPMGLVMNSPAQEVPLAFAGEGEAFYFFRGKTLFSGDVLVDTFAENIWSKNLLYPELQSPVRAWEGDVDLQVFNDSIFLFASRRPGGFGGLDLYVTTRSQQGWTPPVNLGNVINSAYDERAPFLAPDGRTLYFSTNNPRKSIGGLDLVQAYFLDETAKWTPPENMGLPINSAGDDAYFSLLRNGRSAFFSSSRKSSMGGQDIYLANFVQSRGEELYSSDPVAFNLVKKGAMKTWKPTYSTAGTDGGGAGSLELGMLQFTNPFMPIPAEMLPQLEYLGNWLKSYPELKMTFVAHADPNDKGNFPTRPVLQQIAEYLEGMGVPLFQVGLLNAGDSYPMLRSPNHRVEVLVANPEILPVPVVEKEERRRSRRAAFFSNAMKNLVFEAKVKVGGDKQLNRLLELFPSGMLGQSADGKQDFFISGIYLSWPAALEAKREMAQHGFEGAVAVPVLNGWELTKVNAAKYRFEYPALSGFIDGNE